MYDSFDDLVGKKVLRIFLNEEYLQFVTDNGTLTYTVSGDCCSRSIFYDFYGVKNLLNNGPVTKWETVDLLPSDIVKGEYGSDKDKKDEDTEIQVYGYRFTTESPEWGEMSSVVSFRNYSNGYYGGTLNITSDREVSPEIFDDVSETSPSHNGNASHS